MIMLRKHNLQIAGCFPIITYGLWQLKAEIRLPTVPAARGLTLNCSGSLTLLQPYRRNNNRPIQWVVSPVFDKFFYWDSQMSNLTDLVLRPDAATAVFVGSLAVLAVVSLLVLNPPEKYKPNLVSPPTAVAPGLLQGPQLLREGRSVNVPSAPAWTNS